MNKNSFHFVNLYHSLTRTITMAKLKIKQMEDHLNSEVRDEAIKIAVSRKIDIVFNNVFMNITAIDLTDDVIAEIKRRNV